MKFFLALVAAAAADSPDCPESTQVFSFNERGASAAGLVQLSACEQSGVPGITCGPADSQLFAIGINDSDELFTSGESQKFINMAQDAHTD